MTRRLISRMFGAALIVVTLLVTVTATVTLSPSASAQNGDVALDLVMFIVGDDPGTLPQVDLRRTSDGSLVETVFTTGGDIIRIDPGPSQLYFDLPAEWVVDGIHCDGATGSAGGVPAGARTIHLEHDLAAGAQARCEAALRHSTTPEDTGVWGDVNCDNVLDIIDALVVAQYIVGARSGSDGCPDNPVTGLHLGRADINNDAVIDIIDALEASRCSVGIADARCAVPRTWQLASEEALAWPREIIDLPDGSIQVNTRDHVVRINLDGSRTTYGSFAHGNGLHLSDSGEFWATDSRGDNTIHVFDAAGTELRSFGSQGTEPGQFECPNSIHVDQGEVFVFEGDNDRIQVFDEQGTHLRGWGFFGTGEGQFRVECGTASLVVFDDEVFVTDCRNLRVQVFDRGGAFARSWSVVDGSHPWGASCPSGISADGAGRIYVADEYHWIRIYSRTGELLETVWSSYDDWRLDGIGGIYEINGEQRFEELYGIHVNAQGTRVWASHNALPQRVLTFDRPATVGD